MVDVLYISTIFLTTTTLAYTCLGRCVSCIPIPYCIILPNLGVSPHWYALCRMRMHAYLAGTKEVPGFLYAI